VKGNSRRYSAVAIQPDGRRVVMFVSHNRSEAEAFVVRQRLFARSVGVDVILESNEMHVVDARRYA
jgi:hypothetical protein